MNEQHGRMREGERKCVVIRTNEVVWGNHSHGGNLGCMVYSESVISSQYKV